MTHTDYDSIMMARDSNVVMKSEFYKTSKGLPDRGIPMAVRPYSVASDDIILGCLILFAFILAILMYRGRKMIGYRLKEFFSTKRAYSEENMNENNREVYSTFLLTSISALSLGLIVFDYIGTKVGFERVLGIPYWLFAAAYVLFIGFVYLKAWLYALVNWTFFDQDSSDRWMQGYLMLTSLTALFVFPLALVALVDENSRGVVMWCHLFVLAVYELLLFFKLFVTFGGKIYGHVLLFLYFCSVELMPAIVLWRLISWVTDNFIEKLL